MKSFVEGHGGLVRVTSELNHGSRFIAILPLMPPTSTMQVAPPQLPVPEETDRF